MRKYEIDPIWRSAAGLIPKSGLQAVHRRTLRETLAPPPGPGDHMVPSILSVAAKGMVPIRDDGKSRDFPRNLMPRPPRRHFRCEEVAVAAAQCFAPIRRDGRAGRHHPRKHVALNHVARDEFPYGQR